MIANSPPKNGRTRTPEQHVLRDWCRGSVRVPRLRTMREFAEDEIHIPTGPFAGRKYRTERQPYSGLLFDALQQHAWNRRIITGPTQSGKTLQAFVIPTLYHLFEIGETVICGLPTLDMASDKWERDLRPVIEASRYREFLPRRGAGSRGGMPSDVITFGNGAQLKFMGGGGGDKQRAAFTSRVLIITETDGLDQPGDASREADKITQLEGRTRAFGSRAAIYMECTVSTTDGRTWREYDAGTASRLVCPCPHCGAWVSPERDHLRGWQNAPTQVDAEERAHFICPSCEQPLDGQQRAMMNAQTRMIHKGQEIDPAGVIHGAAPRTKTLGFRWSAFQNLFATAGQLGAEEWRAARSEDRDNVERALKQFVWCLPVQEDRVEKSEITAAIVRGSHADYGGRCTGIRREIVPDNAIALTAFVDVHSRADRLLYFVVCAWLRGRRCVVVDYGRWGDPGLRDVVGQEQSIAMNLRDLRRDWNENPYCDSTRAVPFALRLVDASWMQHVVFDFVTEANPQQPLELWRPSMGDPGFQQPHKKQRGKKPSPNGDPWYLARQRSGVWQVNFSADHWKGVVHDAFMVHPLDGSGHQRSGSVRLFGDDHRDHYGFADQVTAEVLQRELTSKGWHQKWVMKAKDNHFLDCMVGNFIAASMCGALQSDTPPPRPPAAAAESRGFIRQPTGFSRRTV